MITVFVWNENIWHKSPGHASVQVGSQYISWWPEQGRSDFGLKMKNNNFLVEGASYANTMAEDKKSEKRNPDYDSAPIKCLDEKKILDWWGTIRPKNNVCAVSYSKDENIYYDLARLSCATIVMRALLIGGGNNVIEPPIPMISTALKCIISVVGGVGGNILAERIIGEAASPSDVKRYAELLVNAQTGK